MLPQKKRLNRKEFDRFFAMGKRIHSPTLTLIFSNEPGLQVSAVAPKKVAKTAVARNKFRRRVYSIFEKLEHGEQAPHGVFICIAKAGANTRTFKSLYEELSTLIHKTRTLR